MAFSSKVCISLLIIIYVFPLPTTCSVITLDTQADSKFWTIKGNYLYASSMNRGGRILPALAGSNATASGVWYFKYLTPREDHQLLKPHLHNNFEFVHRLQHSLMKQVRVKFLAHPTVPLLIYDVKSRPKKFWSSGTSWCNAIIPAHMSSSITVAANFTQPDQFVLIDRITLQVNDPIPKNLLEEGIANCTLEMDEVSSQEGNHHFSNIEPLLVFDSTTTTSAPTASTSNDVSQRKNYPLRTSTFVSGNAKCTCSCTCLTN